MKRLSQKQINLIAQELDCGFICYIHKHADETYFIPDESRLIEIDMDAWEADLKKINQDITNYVVIEAPRSRESFEIMCEFTELLPHSNPLKAKLIRALEKRHPFREFKYLIDQSGEYREKWFAFKTKHLEDHVQTEFTNAMREKSQSEFD